MKSRTLIFKVQCLFISIIETGVYLSSYTIYDTCSCNHDISHSWGTHRNTQAGSDFPCSDHTVHLHDWNWLLLIQLWTIQW